MTVRNTSGTRVNVLASTLDFVGDKLVSQHLDDGTFRDYLRDADQGMAGTADRHVALERSTKVSHGRLVADGFYFDPNEVITKPISTWIPKDHYDLVYLKAWLAVARGKVLALEAEGPSVLAAKDRVTVLTRVPEPGWLQALTRSDRFVRTEYSSDPAPSAVPRAWLTPERRPGPSVSYEERLRKDERLRSFDERLSSFYGYAEVSSEAISWLRK